MRKAYRSRQVSSSANSGSSSSSGSGFPNLAAGLGRAVLGGTAYLGQLGILLVEALGNIFAGRIRWRLVLRQMLEIGVRSQVVILVTGVFTGAVFTAQLYFQFSKVGMESAAGAAVSVSMFRELGPVLVGLMLSGRVGAGMAAELGTMKVTEQVDALRAMGVSPVEYLVTPRLLGMMLCMPILVGIGIACGVLAGYVVGVRIFEIPAPYYLRWMRDWTSYQDLTFAIVKSVIFSIIIAILSCREGLFARDGAVGVGRATTDAVVRASLAVLILNFFLTLLLTMIFPVPGT